ncbi:MAG: aminoglycoside phosphotransferase family protein [Patescibacteria group bacterium]|nr:aminoglycoside phosphotransferase family protein [Patescibacteria group bacterium]
MAAAYTDSDEYQREIAEQYKRRVAKFSHTDVCAAVHALGFDVAENDLTEARAGNMNATYLSPDFAIKVNADKSGRSYSANVLVSEHFAGTLPVVEVLAYDFFEKTPYEVLVMRRAPGRLLLDDMTSLSEDIQKELFAQTLEVVQKLSTLTFDSFGMVREDGGEKTYAEYLRRNLEANLASIRAEKLAEEKDIAAIEEYVSRYLGIFENEMAVFVHNDLHMGNILHDGARVTAIIDFDSALKAPKMRELMSLLGFIANPQQFVEGTPEFGMYQGRSFYHLLPLLRAALPDVFADPALLRKLNIDGICEGLHWVAGNWSAEWNKEMVRNIMERELAETDTALQKSYFGAILAH